MKNSYRIVPCPRCHSVEGKFVFAPDSTCHCECGLKFRITRDLRVKPIVSINQIRALKPAIA